MKKLTLNNTLKYISFILIAIWSLIIILCIYKSITYTSPPGAESMDRAFEIGIYFVFILFSFFGIISALLLYCCVKKSKGVATISAVTTNALHLLSFYALVYINKDFCIIFPLVWIISLIVSFIILNKNIME